MSADKTNGWQRIHETKAVASQIRGALSDLREVMPEAETLGDALDLLGKLDGFIKLMELVKREHGAS